MIVIPRFILQAPQAVETETFDPLTLLSATGPACADGGDDAAAAAELSDEASCQAGIEGLPVRPGNGGGVEAPGTAGPRLSRRVFNDLSSC